MTSICTYSAERTAATVQTAIPNGLPQRLMWSQAKTMPDTSWLELSIEDVAQAAIKHAIHDHFMDFWYTLLPS